MPSRPTRHGAGRLGQRVPHREQLRRALGDRRAVALDRALVAARDRAGERGLRAHARPTGCAVASTSGASCSRVTPAVAASRSAQRLERDEEVRRDRARRVVGDAVLGGRRAVARIPSARGERARGLERALAACRPRRAPAPRRTLGVAARRRRHQRVQREALAVAEHVEARRAGAVADAADPAGTRRGGLAICAVRHGTAGRTSVPARDRLAAPERGRVGQRRGEHRAQTARADDGAGEGDGGLWGPVLASRYRLASF